MGGVPKPGAPMILAALLALASVPADELPLWPDGVPGAPADVPAEVVQERGDNGRWMTGVHVPTITVVRPEPAAATGAAVVICPGGGYGGLALDKEGHDIARWFADAGVVGVVLKYRMPRPGGHVYGHEAPLDDVRRALALVRENADEWGVDRQRVGVMGFSAGGHLAASASVLLDEGGPDFTILVYPVVSMQPEITHSGSRAKLLGPDPPEKIVSRFSCELRVTERTPPAFLVHTADDPIKVENSLRYAAALRAAGIPVELHVFERGGHGYGMRRPELPVGVWPTLLRAWMAGRGLLAG